MDLETHKAARALLNDARLAAHKALADAVAEVVTAAIAAWNATGGCARCHGSGAVITWSTLDGEGYDEHGPCPDCRTNEGRTAAAQAAGLHPQVGGPLGSRGANRVADLWAAEARAPERITPLRLAADEAERAARLDRAPLEKGQILIVVKGRKVPVGAVGIVVGFSANDFGRKVGLLTGSGVLWTADSNVEPVLGLDPQSATDLKILWIDSDRKFRASRRLAVPSHAEYCARMGLTE